MHSGRTRRRRWMMPLTMLLLLGAVLAAAMQVMPRDGGGALSSRHARKMLADAKRWQDESLYISAAEIYERVAQNGSVAQPLRLKAASELVSIYSGPLNDPRRATAALEKAYYLTPEGPQRVALRSQLASLRGVPVVRAADSGTTSETPRVRTVDMPTVEGKPLARLGDETVTVEEVLYAWTIYHQNTPPEGEEFERFVHWYLDIVLLADEARQRGLQETPGVALDVHFRRLMALNQAQRKLLIRDLADPTSESLQQYYEATREQWIVPSRVKLGHIVVKQKSLANDLAEELREGGDFEQLARKNSLDAEKLPKGFELGTIYAAMEEIPHVGRVPGLAGRLVTGRDGSTTGPLQTERGYHLFKILEKKGAEPSPLEAIREDVMLSYQQQALARTQQDLLTKLRKARPIEFLNGAAPRPAATPAEDAAPATETQTTTTTEAAAPKAP